LSPNQQASSVARSSSLDISLSHSQSRGASAVTSRKQTEEYGTYSYFDGPPVAAVGRSSVPLLPIAASTTTHHAMLLDPPEVPHMADLRVQPTEAPAMSKANNPSSIDSRFQPLKHRLELLDAAQISGLEVTTVVEKGQDIGQTSGQDSRDVATVSSVPPLTFTPSLPAFRRKLIVVGDSVTGKTSLIT
jgi:hypothetical protein